MLWTNARNVIPFLLMRIAAEDCPGISCAQMVLLSLREWCRWDTAGDVLVAEIRHGAATARGKA
jgi:hypothetical protein